jgi:cytoskeleton protein RodZ
LAIRTKPRFTKGGRLMTESESVASTAVPVDVQPNAPDAAAPPQPEIAAGPAVQAGVMLQQMRQAAGLDPMLLASALKVALPKIQALEEGRLDDLPGLTFARGLAGAICRYFAVDPNPVLALMPQAVPTVPVEPSERREPFKPSSFHANSDRSDAARQRAGIPGWLLAVVAALLIGALVVWLMPAQMPGASEPQDAASAADGAEPAASATSAAVDAASEPIAQSSAAADAASGAMTQPASASGPPVSPAAAVFQLTPAASAAVPDVGASAPRADLGSGSVEQDVLKFRATGRVWLGVRDGSGKWILNRTLTGGDTLDVGGELPLSVTVGNRNAVSVTVRGQPFNLGKDKRTGGGTTAQFTVNPASNP